MLEAQCWPSNAFATLTYRDDALPPHGVSVQEHQTFMKQLRARWHEASGQTLRFYMCGEYGEKTFRPHYHYALFNYPTCLGPGSRTVGRVFIPCNCNPCAFLSRVWGKGHVYLGTLTAESAQYVAGYVTKKMTKEEDPRLHVTDPITGEISSYNPEFSRMSTRPGIGALRVERLVSDFLNSGLEGDLTGVRHGNRFMPLGRYMKEKISEHLPTEAMSSQTVEARQMFSMLHDIQNNPEIFARALARGSAAAAMSLVGRQNVIKTEQRFNRKERKNEI